MRRYLERISIYETFFSVGLTYICFVHSWCQRRQKKKIIRSRFVEDMSKGSMVGMVWGVQSRITINVMLSAPFYFGTTSHCKRSYI